MIYVYPDRDKKSVGVISCAPSMGDNLVVKVHYALGSRKH